MVEGSSPSRPIKRRLKNKHSERDVPLWPQLRVVLRDYLDGASTPQGRLLFPGVGDEMVVDVRKMLDSVSRARK